VLPSNRRSGAGLAQEALYGLLALQGSGEEELEGDAVAELLVDSRDHNSHAALTQDTLNPVLAGKAIPWGSR
jgi:hypothetical protein